MSNIVKIFTANLADHILEQSIGNFKQVLVIGYDKEGVLDVRATEKLDLKELLWLIEAFKFNLLSGVYDEEGED